jgi:hypothetical protein
MNQTTQYTAESVRTAVEERRTELFASYSVGRSANWTCDQQTKDLICLANWLADELTKIGTSDVDRRTQQWKFNRESRSKTDLFQCAADIMNETLRGEVEQNRIPHHRWG